MVASILLILLAIAIIAAAAFLYRLFYQYRINKQLRDGAVYPRKLLSPGAFLIIIAFTVMIAFAGLSAIFAIRGATFKESGAILPQEYFDATYDFQHYNPSEMTGYRSMFSLDENPGYTKTVSRQGDIQFTCFTSSDAFDLYHPSFIILAEYTGDKDILYSGFMGNFFTPHDLNMGGWGGSGSEFEGYICFMGTSTLECRFELSVGLYDSNLKSENLADHAAAFGTISISCG